MRFTALHLVRTTLTVFLLGGLLVYSGWEIVSVAAKTDELAADAAILEARQVALEGLLHRVSRDASLPTDAPERSTWVVGPADPVPARPIVTDAATPGQLEGEHAAWCAVTAAHQVSPALGVVQAVQVEGLSLVVIGGQGVETVVRASALNELGVWSLMEPDGTDGSLSSVPMSVVSAWSPTEQLGMRLVPVLLAALFLCFSLLGDLFKLWRGRNAAQEAADARALVLQRMSHDLRTPAASVQALVEALHSDAVDSPEERAEFLALLQSEARRLSDGIRVLLRAARGEEAAPVAPIRLDLSEWVSSVGGRWQGRLPGLTVQAPPRCAALADPDRLDEAVDVLLDNALRYGGPNVELVLAVEADEVVLSVVDDGAGVRWYERRRVMKKGVRGWGRNDDGGLGLWVASQVAAGHNGRFAMEGPSRFVIRFPR